MQAKDFGRSGSGGGSLPHNFELRFGDSTGLNGMCECMSCKRIDRSGMFIIVNGKGYLLCVKCVATAVVQWQRTHPAEKVFDVDINVCDDAYPRMAKRLQEIIPGVSDSDAAKACREILDEI